jgi:hypothetical protein
MFFKLALSAILVFAVPVPAMGATPGDQAANTADEKTAEDQKLICRKAQPPVGSRLGPKRVCGTAAEWRQRDATTRESKNFVAEIQARQGSFCVAPMECE